MYLCILAVSAIFYPPKFNTSPLKSYRNLIGKACLPTTIFQGRAVKLRGCIHPIPSSSKQVLFLRYLPGLQRDFWAGEIREGSLFCESILQTILSLWKKQLVSFITSCGTIYFFDNRYTSTTNISTVGYEAMSCCFVSGAALLWGSPQQFNGLGGSCPMASPVQQ